MPYSQFVWLILLFIGDLKVSLSFCLKHKTFTKRQPVAPIQCKDLGGESEVLGTVCMDYSAANEYIRVHYGDQSPRLPLYFEKDESMEIVYDARYGVYTGDPTANNNLRASDTSSSSHEKQRASLKTCGFELVSPAISMGSSSERNDWNNLKWIQQHYLPQLQKHLERLYSSNQRPIRQMLFWNPMMRGPSKVRNEDKSVNASTTPKASYAALPHIDMDVNAYHKFEDFLDLMENNEVDVLDESGRNVNHPQWQRQDILDSIQNKNCGFAIVNAWCNVGSHPVGKDPLGLFSVQYDKGTASAAAFPVAAPNMKTSRWYAFSNIIPNEVLLFCQYDRDASWPSDLWHCSLDGIARQQDDLPERESFDIRCLLVFEEEVPLEHDRFQRINRLGSLLSLEESECFCEGQFEKRLEEDAASD